MKLVTILRRLECVQVEERGNRRGMERLPSPARRTGAGCCYLVKDRDSLDVCGGIAINEEGLEGEKAKAMETHSMGTT